MTSLFSLNLIAKNESATNARLIPSIGYEKFWISPINPAIERTIGVIFT